MIGRAIASTLAIVDVSTVFITGSVVDTFGDPLLEAIHREVMLRSRLTHLGDFSLVELTDPVQPLVAAAALVATHGLAALVGLPAHATDLHRRCRGLPREGAGVPRREAAGRLAGHRCARG